MTAYDPSSFSAGQDSGTRIAACIARLAALELVDASRWWNRRRRKLMASALVACAQEMEDAADASERGDSAVAEGVPAPRVLRAVPVWEAARMSRALAPVPR